MATVANSRDVYLQAFTPRVNTVQSHDNVTVDSSKITGDGFEIIGNKRLKVVASTQIIKHYTATGDDVATVNLTAIRSNLTSQINIGIMSGTLSGSYSFGEGSNLSILSSDIVSDKLVLDIYTTQDSITYRDYVTIVRSREGSSSFVSYLTQEYAVIPADSLGNPLSYADASGYVKIWQGTYDVTSSFTHSVHSNPNDLTLTIDSSSGAYSVSSGMKSVGSSTVGIRSVQGGTTIYLPFEIVKVNGSYNGVRNQRQFSVPLNNVSTFSDTLANSIASTDGGPVLGDLVIQFDVSGSFSKTKFWTGSTWVELNAFVDGNLLVKGSVVAEKLSVGELSAITADVGNLVISSDGSITSEDFDELASGVKITGGVGSEIIINKGKIGGASITAESVESNYTATTGWKLDNATGKITAHDAEFVSADGGRVFNLGATGSAPVLKVDEAITITADGVMTIDAIDVIDTVNIRNGAISSQLLVSSSTATTINSYSYTTIATSGATPISGLYLVAVSLSASSVDYDSVANLRLLVDGVPVSTKLVGVRTSGADTHWWLPASFVYSGSNTTGNLTFSVQAKCETEFDGHPAAFSVNEITLTVNNTKR